MTGTLPITDRYALREGDTATFARRVMGGPAFTGPVYAINGGSNLYWAGNLLRDVTNPTGLWKFISATRPKPPKPPKKPLPKNLSIIEVTHSDDEGNLPNGTRLVGPDSTGYFRATADPSAGWDFSIRDYTTLRRLA